MSDNNNTASYAHYSLGGRLDAADLEPAEAYMADGQLHVRPFGLTPPDFHFAVSIERWRQIAAAVEQAITDATTANLSAVSL
ncbi:hypothetical protein [Mycobacterium intracellulare]|uniref:hypothetical protein n=1 Tax=Mycobacterium intracellulare TaxID=1767 RepID=UPI00259706E3|nr:hypothetical protein [Mycobacterium intracellulare]MDM3894796.1 hypothetical protein [Mycobacterium intracellulare]